MRLDSGALAAASDLEEFLAREHRMVEEVSPELFDEDKRLCGSRNFVHCVLARKGWIGKGILADHRCQQLFQLCLLSGLEIGEADAHA